ncbi:MAG: ABC transporter ATP-binding protein [Candidatus Dormibacteraeota bacterium]|nr:ABC transporter ATP-binding protein [Candidatus Dormibacteraeota bacterium]
MNLVDGLVALFHGPFGSQPFAVLAWQCLLGGAAYFAARFVRGRFPRQAATPFRVAGQGASVALRNRYVLLSIGLLLPLVELLTGGYLLTVTYSIELYVLLAIGLNIVVGFTGLLDLGYVAFFAVGAYVYGLLASPQLYEITHQTLYFLVPKSGLSASPGFHISMLLLMPIAGFAAALFGVLIGIPTLRLRGDYLAIVTLGFGEITRIFANNLDQPVNITNGPNGLINIDPVWIGSYSFGNPNNYLGPFHIPSFLNYYYLVLILILITVFFVSRLERSRVGRAWAAIREDETAAQMAGINTRNLKLLAYASGGFFGGMAGAVYAAGQHLIAPDSFQLFVSILVLCMVVAGGMGSIPGSVLGAIVIGAIYFLTSQLLYLRILIFGALLVILITLRPQGLLPSVQRARELEETDDDPSLTGAPPSTAPA